LTCSGKSRLRITKETMSRQNDRQQSSVLMGDTWTCEFKRWKSSKFWTAKRKPLIDAIVTSLLNDGKVRLTGLFREKTGKTYDAPMSRLTISPCSSTNYTPLRSSRNGSRNSCSQQIENFEWGNYQEGLLWQRYCYLTTIENSRRKLGK